tara:strand:- start:163 stop:726 length:564 start_codon:yes stop_codon:yes gene_type:complete
MCEWKKDYAKQFTCEGIVMDSGSGEFIVKGRISNLGNPTVMFWAANPPTYNGSYSGSGLPFPNADIAYDNTVNKGAVKALGGSFQFRVRYPNAYYMGLGSVYVEPCVHIKVCGEEKIQTIKLGNGIPFRMMTYPPSGNASRPRDGPLFYKGRGELEMRTQEQILRDSGYPRENIMPENFWGKAVPHE